jgi:preprotein translocase subunit SecB
MAEKQDKQQEPQFMIQRVYVKDASFEAPNTPDVFKEDWEPKLDLDLSSRSKKVEDNIYEVELNVTATVNNKDKVAFISEVKQAGIFTIEGAPEDQLGHLLGSFCPNILFPYAREVVSDMVMKASFPQLVLAPVNFDALYMQQLEQQKESKKETSE